MTGAGRWIVAIFALIGLGIGLVGFALRTPTYEASVLVAVSNPIGPLADEVEVVTGPTVINAATAALGFAPEVTVSAGEVTSLLTITAVADDAQQAADAANVVAQTYVQAQLGAAANVAQQAQVPDSASGLGPLEFAAIGTSLGAVVGAAMGFLVGLRSSTQRTSAASAAAARHETLVPPAGMLPSPEADYVAPSPVSASLDDFPAVDAPPDLALPVEPVDAQLPTPEPTRPATSSSPSPFLDAASSDLTRENPIDTPPEVPDTDLEQSWLAEPAADSHEAPTVSTTASTTESTTTASTTTASTTATDEPPTPDFGDLDRRALQSQFESAQYERELAYEQEVARLTADHERQTVELRTEVANLNKQVRMQAVRLKSQSGTDQSRVGDLEAQVDALEIELAGLRQTLEAERIDHTKRITDERGAADRALDNARRQYREELAKHVHSHRQSLAEHRSDLDNELAEDRSKQAAALEAEHLDYERQVEIERQRADAKIGAAADRHQRELVELQATHKQEMDRQAAQHKDTITSLRGTSESTDEQLRELEKENRLLRAEISSLQKQARHNETDHASTVQRLSDELSIMRAELESERERNTALRADVLRRSAESHQAIDKAVEERTAQMAELEASVSRQRDYADKRVREVSSAAEEAARQAATREAGLTATVSRLKRELEEIKGRQSHN